MNAQTAIQGDVEKSIKSTHAFVVGILLGIAVSSLFFFFEWQVLKGDLSKRLERKMLTETAIAVLRKNGAEMYLSDTVADRFWKDQTAYQIELRNLAISDVDLRLIKDAHEIVSMNLDGTQISDEGLLLLASLPDLKLLDVRRTPVSKNAVDNFRTLRPDCKLFSDH